MIRLSPQLALPPDAVTQKVAFLARSGAGKTYAAGVLVEELARIKAQYVVVDPIGTWWGLRLAADGKSPGLTVYVFGGDQGDLPLEPGAGALMASVIVEHGISCVLDVSDMTHGEQRRFVGDFATELLQRKKRARSPLMVVWEEAQDFVPQHVMRDAARMVGAMERLIKQGRNFGIGTTLISQRPQAVNKDALNQTECLVVMQTTGPQERKTIQGWVAENAADVEAAVEELPSLERGEAFVWSPQWLRVFKRVKIGTKWTYDASSTPTGTVEARKISPVDLDVLRGKMADAVERAKQDDPALLRKELARLKAELTKRPEPKHVEVPAISEATLARVDKLLDRFAISQQKLANVSCDLQDALETLTKQVGNLPGTKSKATEPYRMARGLHMVPRKPMSASTSEHVAAVLEKETASLNQEALSRSQLQVLRALMWFEAFDVAAPSREAVALIAGTRPTSGGYKNNLGALRSMGLVDYPQPNAVALTDRGRALAPMPDVMPTTEGLHKAALAAVTTSQRAILWELLSRFGRPVPRAQIARDIDVPETSGGFKNNLGALRTLGLIDYPSPGLVQATGILFPQGRPQ